MSTSSAAHRPPLSRWFALLLIAAAIVSAVMAQRATRDFRRNLAACPSPIAYFYNGERVEVANWPGYFAEKRRDAWIGLALRLAALALLAAAHWRWRSAAFLLPATALALLLMAQTVLAAPTKEILCSVSHASGLR